MEKSNQISVSPDKLEFATSSRTTEVLSRLQASSTETFLAEITGVTFSITFRKAIKEGISVRLDGVVAESGEGSKSKIEISNPAWAMGQKTICRSLFTVCGFYLLNYFICHSNWVFLDIILTVLLLSSIEKEMKITKELSRPRESVTPQISKGSVS
jgi:hypothetical protein